MDGVKHNQAAAKFTPKNALRRKKDASWKDGTEGHAPGLRAMGVNSVHMCFSRRVHQGAPGAEKADLASPVTGLVTSQE